MKKILVYLFITMLIFSAVVYAENTDGNIRIKKETRHLHSRLSKEYTGYIYKIKNTSERPIEILGITIGNDLTGKAASSSVQRSSLVAGVRTVGTGVVYALPTLTLSLIGSAFIAPIKMAANSAGNIGAKQEGKRYSKSVQNIVLKPNDSIELKTLAVKRSSPKMRVIYKIEGAQEVITFDYK